MIAQYPHFLCVTQITYEGRKKLLDLSLCQVISRSTKQNHYSLCVLLPPSSLDLRLMQPLGIMSLSRDAFFCFCDVAAVWIDIYKTLFSLTTANGRYVFPAKVHFSICKLTFFFSVSHTNTLVSELSEDWSSVREPVIEGVPFYAKYLGSSIVQRASGEEATADAIKTIIAMVRKRKNG